MRDRRSALWTIAAAAAAVAGCVAAGDGSPAVARAQQLGFKLMPAPRPGDWLAQHHEPGQTFRDYVASKPVRASARRSKIYIQPFGSMGDAAEMMGRLTGFVERYYCLPVVLQPAAATPKGPTRQRLHGTQHTVWPFMEILRRGLPSDAVCRMGVTMVDLYPDDRWNYVFGQASLRSRVGVYSLVRFFPAFWGRPDSPPARKLALQHSIATLSHEIGHMFGMLHCIHFLCNLSGSNSLAESDRQPIHLCPICLRKLQWNLGFDVAKRYQGLKSFYHRNGLTEEESCVSQHLNQSDLTERELDALDAWARDWRPPGAALRSRLPGISRRGRLSLLTAAFALLAVALLAARRKRRALDAAPRPSECIAE